MKRGRDGNLNPQKDRENFDHKNDIDDVDNLAAEFTLAQTNSQIEKERKKKYAKKTNKFIEFYNDSYIDQKKLTQQIGQNF